MNALIVTGKSDTRYSIKFDHKILRPVLLNFELSERIFSLQGINTTYLT